MGKGPPLERIYVSNYDDSTVSIIDALTSAVINPITVGVRLWGIAAYNSEGNLYIDASGDNVV